MRQGIKNIDRKKKVLEQEQEQISLGGLEELELELEEILLEEDKDVKSSDEDDEIPKKKKASKDDGSQVFAEAFKNIIGSKLKAHDRSEPILARNKSAVRKLESDKLEAKAKRALLAEKKQLYEKHRVKNLLSGSNDNVRQVLETERKLKKTAQKGVVRLFNAILSTQVKTNEALKTEKVGEVKKDELFNEMSKEKFLNLIETANK